MEPVQQSVQQPVSNNRALYDNLINSKRVTADQIGDFDTFNNMLSDPSNATALHDNLIKQGGFKEEEIGSQYDFMKNIDPIQAPSQPLETPSAKQPFSSVDPAVHNIAQADSIDAVNRGITPQMEMQEPRPDTTDWNYRPDDKSSQISFTEHPLDATGQWMKDLWGSGKQATQEASNLIQKGTQEVAGYANELANWMDDSPTKKSTAENQKVDEHIKANLDNLNTEKATIQQYTPMYKSAGYVGGAAPYAALAATSLLTGSGEVAVASKLGFALLGVGTGADAYEKHVENTGESENKGTKALTELLYGTLYAGPIPAVVGKYMPKSWIGTILGKEVLNPEVQNTAGKIAFETFAKDQPTLAGRYISTLVKDAPASVASMETMMVGSKAVDQFVIGDDVKAKDYWETAKGAALTGIAFHAVIGAFATGKAGPDMIKRWDSQGSVGITLDAKGRSVEVLPSVEGKPQKGMRPDGTIVDVTPEMAKNTFIVPTELLKSELGKFKQTGSTSPTIERDAYLGNVSNFLNKITNTDGLIYSTIDQSGKEQFGIGKDSQGNTLLVDRSGNQSTMQSAPQWTTTDPKVLFKQFEDGYKPNSQRIGEAQPGQPTAPVQPVDPRTQAQQQAATFYDQHKDQDSGLLRTIGQTTPDGENTKCWFITKEVDGGEGNQFYIVEDGEGNHESISKSQVTGEIQEIGQEDFINSKLGAYDQNQQLQQQAQQNQLTYQGQVLDRIDNPEAKTKKYETFTDKDGGFVNVPNEIVAAWEKSKQQDPNANPNIVTQSYGKTQVTGEKDAQGNLAVSDPMTVDQTENLKAEVERTTGGKATVKAAEIPNNDPTQQGSYQVSIVPNVVPVVTSSQPVTQPVAERKIITQKFGNTELDIVEGDGYDEVVPSEKMPLEKALPVLEKKFKDHPKFKLQVDKSQVEIPAETKYDDPTYKTVIKSIRIIPKNANNSKPKNENVDQNNGENAVNQQSLTTDSSQNLQENEQTNEKGLQNVSQAEQPNVGNSTGETGITENTNGETYISRTSDELAPPPADQMPVGEISIPTTRKIRAVQNEDTAQPTSDVPSDTNSPDTEVATVQNIEPLTPESNEQHTKGVNNVFIQNPELVNIGTPKEYSEYLNGIFPDSRLKDVVYHIGWVKNEFDKNKIGTGEGSLVLGRGFYFGTDDLTSIATQVGFEEVVREANGDQNEIIKGLGDHLKIGVLDIQNPYYEKGDLRWGNVSGNEQLIRDVTKLNDGIISDGEYIVFEPDQIHILGSEKDIEGFKKYKLNGTEPTNLTPSNDRGNGTPLAEQGNSDKVSSSDQSATELSPNSSNTGVEKGAEKTKGINGIITNFNQNVKKQRNGRKPRSTKVIESEVENAEQLSETASTETEIAEAEQVIIDLTAEIDDAIEIIDLGFTKEKRINENTLNSVGVLGESSFIESGIDKYVSEKGLDKQEFEDSDEYNSKFNELSDSYPDYIKELANSGQLQTIYDNSNLGQQIEISKTIQLAGFEVKDLIDLSKVRNEAKSKKEVEKQEKLDKLHEAIGISKSLPLSEVLSNAKKAVEEKKAESKIANDTNLLSDVKVKQEDNPVTEKQPLKPLEDVLKEAKEKVEGNKSGNNILNEPEATYGKKKPVGFYSTVEKALTRIQQEKGTTDQFKAMLLKNGAKQAELDWMGFDEQFKDKKSLTKQEVQEWIDQNRIDVKEITKSYKWNGKFENTITDEDGNTSVVKFSQYVEPGGENYKELLLTMPSEALPPKKGDAERLDMLREQRIQAVEQGNTQKIRDIDTQITILLKRIDPSKDFRSSHYDEPNILAHIRFNERTGENGERVLFLEEIQSDWAQKGKKEGFKNDRADMVSGIAWNTYGVMNTSDLSSADKDAYIEEYKSDAQKEGISWKEIETAIANKDFNKVRRSVPAMPFAKTDQWVNLAFRRMMLYATENGFDRIAWTNGEMQVARYDLSKQIKSVEVSSRNANRPRFKPGIILPTDEAKDFTHYDIEAIDNNGKVAFKKEGTREELPDIVGKDLADKIIVNANGESQIYSGLDLKVGGEGMKAFYDAIVPSAANKLGKPFGARVENTKLPEFYIHEGKPYKSLNEESGITVRSLPVTDSMREIIEKEGIPLFEPSSPYNKPLLDFLKEAKEKVSEKKVDNSVNSDNFTANENQKTYQTEAGETIPYRTFSSINDGANSGDIQRQADRSSNPSLRGLNKGERSSVEMKYTADKNFMFSGKNKIESTDDVAYLFRQLENKSVENMFACLVKDGKPVIIHLSMGTSSSTLMNYGVLNDAITRFSPDKVYLIHNHPSGSLEPSQADISIHQQAVGAYGDMMGEHIIINLKTGKYARFRMGEGDHLILNRPTSEKTPSNYKVIKFDKQVFKQDAILPMQVSESGEVAQFLSQQRFTKGVKLSAVILDRGMQIKAYLHLSASDFTTGEGVRQLAKELQAYAGRFGGQNVILFGQKVDLNNTQSVNGLTALKATLKKSEIALQDYLSIGKVVTFDSMFDNGLLQEPQGSFGNSEVHDSHVPLEDFLKNAKAKVLENRKSKPKLKDFATEDDYNKAVKAWSKAKEVLTPEEHKAILTNLGNNVGDKSISEIGKQAEDEWLGNRDVESTKANLEATRQQEEIKKSFHRGGVAKTWQEIDKAITHYIEHGSDINSDEKTSYDHLTNYDKHIIDVARNLTPDQIKIANEIKSQNDAIGLKSFQAGQIDNVIENHVNHIWNREGKLTPSDYFTNFSQKTGHAKKRVFPKITDGLKAGFTQKVEGATNSLMIKKIEMNNAIEGRKLVDKGLKTFGNDGMPLFTTKAGVPGYKKIDHYNFTKWRKVKKVKNVSGKPLKDENVMIGKEGKVMVKKAIFAPAEIADRLNTILGNGIKWGPFKVMQQFNGAVKQTVLSFSFFHPLNFMKNYYLTEHVKNLSDLNMVGSYKKGLKMAKEFGPLAEKLVRGGMTVGKTQEWDELNEVSASKLGKKLSLLPYAGPVKDAIVNLHKAQNDWIFKQMGVGLKFKQGISELQRQIKLNPNTDPDILAKNVGELMNNLYGGINRDRKHRSKITQGIFSLLTFAPDWTETNFSNFFKATHFDFSDATTGDKVTKIDKMAEWFRSGFKGVNPDEHKMYMKMWGGLMLRAAVITTAMNLAMALFNDPDHEEEYWQTVKRMFKDSFSNPLRLNWLAPNITPVHNAFVGTDDKQHYFNVLGPFMDAVKMVAEPISFLKNKSSVLARLTLNALTGSNWQGKSYTTASELAGTDDKGMYATSNKKTGVKAGDLKGGRHEGQLTKYAAPGEEKVLSWSQMPSFGLETLRSMFPIGVQGAMEYGEGEKDGWQTLTTGLGLKMASAKEPTTDYPKIAKGITTKADIYIGVIKDAMRTNDKVLADKLQNDPLYKTVQDIYGQGKAINRIKKAIELYKEMGNTSEADHYQKQLDDLYKEVAEKYSEINFPDKYR